MDKPHYQLTLATHWKTQNHTRYLQINLQHSRSATYSMMKMTEKEEPDLVFVQEPYEYQNKPVGIEKKYRIFSAGNGKYSATVVIPNNEIDAMLIMQI